jgi:hypothetical protein
LLGSVEDFAAGLEQLRRLLFEQPLGLGSGRLYLERVSVGPTYRHGLHRLDLCATAL